MRFSARLLTLSHIHKNEHHGHKMYLVSKQGLWLRSWVANMTAFLTSFPSDCFRSNHPEEAVYGHALTDVPRSWYFLLSLILMLESCIEGHRWSRYAREEYRQDFSATWKITRSSKLRGAPLLSKAYWDHLHQMNWISVNVIRGDEW